MIKVAMFGMDDRTQNIIMMFLAKNTKIPTAIVSRGEQTVAIVDLDGVDSQRIWMDLRRQFHGPAIVLSVREQTLRNAFCLAKPFNAQAFLAVLEQVHNTLAQPTTPSVTQPAARLMAAPAQAATPIAVSNASPPAPTTSPAPNLAPKAAPPASADAANPRPELPLPADQPSRAAQLISDDTDDESGFLIPDEVYTDPARRAQVFFNPSQTLLGLCKLASKQAQTANSVARIDGFVKPCYVYPDTKHLFTEMRWRYLKSISMMDLAASPVKLSLISADSIPAVSSKDPRIHNAEEMIWSIATWSSRGRVPTGTPLDHPVHLRHWPNLTRLSEIPGAMQMSALWIKQPTSLLDTAVFLGIPYRHVFSFYVACQTLGLVHIEVTAQPAHIKTETNAPITTEKRGLFSRMLSKLGIK